MLPSCVIVTVCPPTVTVLIRDAPLLGDTVIVIGPLPVGGGRGPGPTTGVGGTVKNGESLTHVHWHGATTVTSIVTVPPLLLILAVVAERVTVHSTPARATDWNTPTMAVPIAMLAERGAPVLVVML